MNDPPTMALPGTEVGDTRRGRRIPWVEIWNSAINQDVSLDEFVDSLPSRSRQRNTPERCTLDHGKFDDDESLMTRHTMRRIITRCTSARCKETEIKCQCRYRVLTCEKSNLAAVSVDGDHTMQDTSVMSPTSKLPVLTDNMKKCIDERLEEDSTITPVALFGIICKKISRMTLEGPPPLLNQVQSHTKRWRKAHRRDIMQPVIDLCRQHMYDTLVNISDEPTDLIILCDTKHEENTIAPKLGDGSALYPFRIGITSFSMLETYVEAQRDPRCTTILHIDSTHSIVKQKFPVFVFGFSDCRCKFFPMIYFCTSQRTGKDVAWCISYTKRIIREIFFIAFSPAFIMSDADNAQFDACQVALPQSKWLMCWFHVCQNVKDRTKGKLERVTIDKIFRDLNNLHYARNEEEYLSRRSLVLSSWRSASAFCEHFRKVADHIISQWILHPRFSQWQAFHTPPGYAATNNPLEQYHKTLKLVNKSKKAAPFEMIERLDQSRLVFINTKFTFKSSSQVSQRLKALYNLTTRKHELSAKIVPTADDIPAQLVQVQHFPKRRYGDNESCPANDFFAEPDNKKLPYKSIHVLRMQWKNMPVDGWLVKAVSRLCGCLFSGKFGLCVHIIHATRQLQIHCPGMPDGERIFATTGGQLRRERLTTLENQIENSQETAPSETATTALSIQCIDGRPLYGPRWRGSPPEQSHPVSVYASRLGTYRAPPELHEPISPLNLNGESDRHFGAHGLSSRNSNEYENVLTFVSNPTGWVNSNNSEESQPANIAHEEVTSATLLHGPSQPTRIVESSSPHHLVNPHIIAVRGARMILPLSETAAEQALSEVDSSENSETTRGWFEETTENRSTNTLPSTRRTSCDQTKRRRY